MTGTLETRAASRSLDPVTFEVLKNAFATAVDLMAEQILRTCYSFVIYARDFSSALCDRHGNTIMQGSQDIAVHVGTLHFTCKAVIEEFAGDIHPEDIFAVNDPYRGGTHFCDVRIIKPIFYEGEIIAFAQSNGHWADVGGSVPGSFDITARDHFGEGLRIPPIRIWDRGVFREDIAKMIASASRAPADILGDLAAQTEATRVCEREILRLVDKYGVDTVLTAFDEVQDYVERLTRQRIAELPDGVWETEDYLDYDPAGEEGLIPVKVKLEIAGDQLHYDLTGSHAAVGSFLNSGYGATFSGLVAGTKTFFPDIPLNSGFYRVVQAELGPVGTVVNAPWPVAVTGFCAGPYEKIMSSCFEIWSKIMPERAIAASFNLEYLLVGGRDLRSPESPYFMWYDWMVGGWGGRNGRDGATATAPLFGVGLAVQPLEGQERLCPVITSQHAILADSGGPGQFRGGCGVEKGGTLTDAHQTVMSYCCDRARSVTWGIEGGLPSLPHGVWLNKGREGERFLGAVFSGVPVVPGDYFTRPSAGGGGFGDPLERDPEAVLRDVEDGYVTIAGARRDYGVVVEEIDIEVCEYQLDLEATRSVREEIRASRREWLKEDAEDVATRYRTGEIDVFDCVRRYGVILHWGTGELFPETTRQFREMVGRRAVAHWR